MSSSGLRGYRIGALSEYCGKSRKELAAAAGVASSRLSAIETGKAPFPASLAERLSDITGVPTSFFAVDDGRIGQVTPTFRKKARARVGEEKRLVRLAREAARVFEMASSDSGYRAFEFPGDAELLEDREQCAREFRRAGGVKDGEPVPNVVRLLERQGVGVITALAAQPPAKDGEYVPDLSGISFPTRLCSRPLAAIAYPTPGAVARFTLAHETAHLIWDVDLPSTLTSTRDERELRAHKFAGAVLLPPEMMAQRVSEASTLTDLLPIKAEFGASVGAIIMRASDLGLISDARKRSLRIQVSTLGWRNPANEPVSVESERPLLLAQTLARAVPSGKAVDLMEYTGVPAQQIRTWTADPREKGEEVAEIIDLRSARKKRAAVVR